MEAPSAALKSKSPQAGSVPLLITGTPRAGAAIVAQSLAVSDVFLGDRIGTTDNKVQLDGWCDRDVAAFHEQQLAAAGVRTGNGASGSNGPERQVAFAEAPGSVLDKFLGQALWAWKDSRAVWFLDAWSRLLPDAYWLLVVRRPAESAWAEAAAPRHLNVTRRQVAQQALQRWSAVAGQIVAYARQNPRRSTVLLLPDDIQAGTAAWCGRIPRPWRNLLSSAPLQDSFNSHLLRADGPRWVRMMALGDRSVRLTWRALQQLRSAAQRPASQFRRRAPAASGLRRVAIVSKNRMAYSQTFIQTHIQGLPADVDWLLLDGSGTALTSDEMPLCSLPERLRFGIYEALGTHHQNHAAKAIGRYLKRRRCEAVLAEFGPIAVGVMDACVAEGVPLIAHFHGYDASRYDVLARYEAEYRRLFETAAALVVVSRDMEQRLRALGAPAEKIEYNPCSVDLDMFDGAMPASVAPTFLATGRFVEKKGPHLTLIAFSRVLAACPEARLLVVGDGPLKPVCQDLAGALNIAEAVRFEGFLPHQQIAALMRTVRGFVQHSVTARDGDAEGTPVAVIEAAASGLPVIATRHEGIKDAVRQATTGYLVKPGDVAAMARHWTELARDPELAGRLGRAAREFIKDSPFDRTHAIGRLWEIIERAIATKN